MDAVLALFGKSHPHYHDVSDLPDHVIERIKTTITQIANEAIETLLFNNLTAKAFVKIHIEPFQKDLANLNDRTYCFFLKMMVPIQEILNRSSTFCNSTELLQVVNNDQTLGEKFVEGISLNPIKKLINELDAIKEHSKDSFVDDINTFQRNLEINW